MVPVMLAALAGMGCPSKDGPKGDSLQAKATIAIDAPVEQAEEVCPGLRCPLEHSLFDEIEYVPDAAGRIKAVVLRCAPPPDRSVQASRESFERIRGLITNALGTGESFLESGDPTYWPERAREKRIMTITINRDERTIIAIGPAGPDAAKIPPSGAANNRKAAQEYWQKILAVPAFAK